jgi:hypothetical protein
LLGNCLVKHVPPFDDGHRLGKHVSAAMNTRNSVAVLQKLDEHTRMDIHSKGIKHTTHEKAAYLTKFHSAVHCNNSASRTY